MRCQAFVAVCISVVVLFGLFTPSYCQRTRTQGKINDQEARSGRVLHFSEGEPASWGPWTSPFTCSMPCGGSGFEERIRNCSTGNNNDCTALGGEFYQVIVCDNGPCTNTTSSTATGWGPWGPTECSTSCGRGFQQRFRNCSTGDQADCEALGGKPWEITVCDKGPCSSPAFTSTAPPTTTQILTAATTTMPTTMMSTTMMATVVCEDVNTVACNLLQQSEPTLCNDPAVASHICKKFCGNCPLECHTCPTLVTNMTQCTATTFCNPNQDCYILEVFEFDKSHGVRGGCMDKDLCVLRGDAANIFGRSSSVVHMECCDTNRCNSHRIQDDTTL